MSKFDRYNRFIRRILANRFVTRKIVVPKIFSRKVTPKINKEKLGQNGEEQFCFNQTPKLPSFSGNKPDKSGKINNRLIGFFGVNKMQKVKSENEVYMHFLLAKLSDYLFVNL